MAESGKSASNSAAVGLKKDAQKEAQKDAQKAVQHSRGAGALPHVVVLATGGTIAGLTRPGTPNRYEAACLEASDLLGRVPELGSWVQVTSEQVSNVASQDITWEIWLALHERIARYLGTDSADAVVITHGTDTLEETAFFLWCTLSHDKPIVLTGAMRPSDAPDADGPANLLSALRLAASSQARGRGPMVCLHGAVVDALRAAKHHTSLLDAFAPDHFKPDGVFYGDSIHFSKPPAKVLAPGSSFFSIPANNKCPLVPIVYACAGMEGDCVEWAVRQGAGAIVLAGLGNGNAPRALLAALHRAACSGVAVVRSTRVGCAPVLPGGEVDDEAMGFVASRHLSPQKARVLLQILLACNERGRAAVQAAFDRFGG